MIIKNRAQLVLIVAIGLSLFSGLLHTADVRESGKSWEQHEENRALRYNIYRNVFSRSPLECIVMECINMLLFKSFYRKCAPAPAVTEKIGEDEDFQKAKLALTNCLLKNTDERTTKIPSACEEALHSFKLVATPVQLNEITRHFKEEITQN